MFDEPEAVGILARFAGDEPAGYGKYGYGSRWLEDYVDAWNELIYENSSF